MVYNCTKKIQLMFNLPCLLCGGGSHSPIQLCHACIDDLPRLENQCYCCAIPLPGDDTRLCGSCLKQKPSYQTIRTPFFYQNKIQELIGDFKFNGKLAEGRVLAQLLARHLSKEITPKPSLLIPAPLHPRRLRQRGFNQSAEITALLSRKLNIPWHPGYLVKTQQTASQNGLTRKQRLTNVNGSFHYHSQHYFSHIAIIDDVVTTGATAEAMARACLQQGVKNVEIWALARTP